MADEPPPRRTSFWLRALVVLVVLVGVALVVIHLAPVRRAVLRAVLPLAERRGVRVEVDSLDYNIFRLRATANGVRVAATRTPDQPFFEARRVTASAPVSVLRGIFSLSRIEITGGRVRIVRTAAGSNLPESTSPSTSEPAPLRLGRISGDLAVDVRDDVARYSLEFARLDLDLSPTGGQISSGTGQIGIRGQVLNVSRLAGGASFDGRDVTLDGLDLASDALTVRVDGPVTVVSRNPAMDLQVSGAGDVARLSAIATPTPTFDGQVSFDGTVAGPFGSPVADLHVRSARLVRDRLALTDVDLTTRVDVNRTDIAEAAFGLAGGRVNAAAGVAFDGSATSINARWTNVDVPTLIGELVDRPATVLPAGRTSGSGTSNGPGFDPAAWTTSARVEVASAANAPNRFALPGTSELRVDNRSWRLTGQHRFGDVAPVDFALTGQFRRDGGIPMTGMAELSPTAVPPLASMLTTVGLASLDGIFAAGTVTAVSTVGGDLTMPLLQGTATVEDLRGEQFAVGPARVAFDGAPIDGDIQLDVAAETLQVAWQSVTDVTMTGRIQDSALTVASFAASQPEGAGMLRGAGRYEFPTRAYDVNAALERWSLDRSPALPLRGDVALTFTGAGTLDRPAGRAEATVTEAFYENLPLGTITAQTVLDGEQATVQAAIPRLNATVTGRSSLTAPYQAVADVQVQALDLSRLQPLVPASTLMLNGTATATAHADGALSAWRDASATVDLTAAEGLVGSLSVMLDGPAQVFYNAGTVGTPRLALRSGGVRAEVRGSLPVSTMPGSDAAMTLTLIGDLGELVSAARASGSVDVPAISGSGPVAVLGRVEGALSAPEISADLDLGPASLTVANLPPFESLRVLGRVENGVAELQDAVATVEGAQLSATGGAPLSWLSSSLPAPPPGTPAVGRLTASLKNVTAALLSRLATGNATPDLGGSLDATIDLASTSPDVAAVTGEARIDRLDLNAAGVVITQQAPTRIVADRGTARIVSWNWRGEGTSLVLSGDVGLRTREANVRADGQLDLRLLTPFIRSAGVSAAGTVTPQLAVTGAITSPTVNGSVALTDVDVRIDEARVFISGLTTRATVRGNTIDIPPTTGSINGGQLTLDGSLAFGKGGASTATLTARIANMALEYPEGLRTELDGSLMLDLGQESEGIERVPLLFGSLHIANGSYRQPVTVVGGLLAAMQSRVNTAPMPVAEPGFADRLVLDVTVTTDQDIVVDNNVATLALDADVRVIGTLAQPALSGRADVREGGRVLLGRNTYQIVSGSLDFANPNRIDPDLNAEMTTRAGGVQIDLMLTGTVSSPMLALSSPDGEFAQSDLTSLLLTGRTLDQLGSADAAAVGDVLVGNLSGEVGQVLGIAGRVVGIDAIRLGAIDNSILQSDPGAIAVETDPTSRLTFTKSLGANFDLIFSQNLREGDRQTWVVEYRPTRRLMARLVSDDDNLRRYEFRHDVRIGASPMGPTSDRPQRTDVRVSEVRIEGEMPGQNLRDLLALEPGKRFDFATLQDDRDRLEEFYRTQGYLTVRVAARQMTSGDMVAVTFSVNPGPRTRIEVTGEPLPRRLVDEIADTWADALAGPLLVDEVRTLVRNRLGDEGYFRAMVDVQIGEVDGVQVLTVAAQRGPQTREVVVTLDGVAGDLSDQLSDKLAAERLVDEAPRDPGAVQESIESGLRALGYLDPAVAVDSPVYEGERAVVTVHVQPGRQILLGPVTVAGSTLDMDAVRAALDLTEGLSYLQAAVDNAQTRLTSFYRQEGFPNATVTIDTIPRPEQGDIAVSVMVDEGARQMIAGVRVEGLQKIDEDVVRNAMDLEPGQPARAEDILRARTRVYATGLFRRVDVTSMAADTPAAPGQLPVSILATVEEWPMLRFRYGFQLAEERPDDGSSRRDLVPGISADVTRRTVFGRAVTVGAATVLQRRDRLGRLFVTAPTFLSQAIRSSFNVEMRREEFTFNRVSETRRVSWEQRTRVLERLTMSYSYRFERVHSFPIVVNPDVPQLDVRLNVARLTGAAAWDTRSDPATPVSGSLLSATFEQAPHWTGSQIRFIRLFTQARHFESWKGTVFASAVQYGVITPLGGQDVIPTERFYTGGGTSIRGLPEDGAGPRDILGPTGGRVLLLFNQEARIPLYRWFQGVAFLDAGNVFSRPREMSVSDLVTSVGLGVRVVTPFALLRVDFGRPVNNTINDSAGRWTFGIGHVF